MPTIIFEIFCVQNAVGKKLSLFGLKQTFKYLKPVTAEILHDNRSPRMNYSGLLASMENTDLEVLENNVGTKIFGPKTIKLFGNMK